MLWAACRHLTATNDGAGAYTPFRESLALFLDAGGDGAYTSFANRTRSFSTQRY